MFLKPIKRMNFNPNMTVMLNIKNFEYSQIKSLKFVYFCKFDCYVIKSKDSLAWLS